MAQGANAAVYEIATGAVAAAAAGGLLAVLNDSDSDRLITRAVCRVTDASDAAGTMDIGIAADAVTSNDTILDGVDFNATGITDKITGTGNASPEATLWPSGQYLTASKATGAANAEKNLVAHLAVQWITDVVNAE